MTDCCELVAEYHYRQDQGVVRIYACYATPQDMDERNVDYYEVYDQNGVCLSEGELWQRIPEWITVKLWLTTRDAKEWLHEQANHD